MPRSPLIPMVVEARRELNWSQRQLGEALGASMRTASRWEAGRARLYEDQITTLARHVYPVRPDLAERLAGAFGHTLVGLGIAPPPLPPPEPVGRVEAAASLPALRVMTVRDAVDCITCAVADIANAAPKAVRPMVLLALRRAHELGMNLDAAVREGALDAEPANVNAASLRKAEDSA
jgi:transcriptional regulator with XRE-family HTH domain